MKQIFINLPVSDLKKSDGFYSAIGFKNNPQFSDESARCMVWSEHIYVMIMTHERFSSFTSKPIADTKTQLSALYSLSVGSVKEMNEIVSSGLSAGGNEPSEMKDHGFMQLRSLEDPDGFTWEIFFMDMSKLPQ